MTIVVSVRFKESGRTYYFDPGELDLRSGDMVIVETVHGPELAKVIYEQFDVAENKVVGELKPVLRRADQTDFDQAYGLNVDYDEIMARCNEKINEHGLDMNLVKAEYNFYGSRLTFYFTAEKRVDFRLLVRDLARAFKTRIELRQIGPRDEARLLGGIGICGRMLCCSTFLPDYTRVSIKMAKDQDLPLNPAKISGVCNRLLCCLSYEHQQYVELKADLPRRGNWVETQDGKGQVVEVNVLQQVVTVQLAQSGMQEHYRVSEIQETTPPPRRESGAKQQATTERKHDRLDNVMKQATSFLEDDESNNEEMLKLLEDDDVRDEEYEDSSKQAPRASKKRPSSDARSRTGATQSQGGGAEAGRSSSSKRGRRRRRKSTTQSQHKEETSQTQQAAPKKERSAQPQRRRRKPASSAKSKQEKEQ